ncbi:hypothetical protein [Neisseria sp. Ec49-e6-T10]|uniref:hypothetical protein n=1 Tax=Neisseria sp. Ec49-e6-T10 TaxID=3140744 RepID=UPI003EC006B1
MQLDSAFFPTQILSEQEDSFFSGEIELNHQLIECSLEIDKQLSAYPDLITSAENLLDQLDQLNLNALVEIEQDYFDDHEGACAVYFQRYAEYLAEEGMVDAEDYETEQLLYHLKLKAITLTVQEELGELILCLSYGVEQGAFSELLAVYFDQDGNLAIIIHKH